MHNPKHINIISLASDRHVVYSYHEAILSLQSRHISVDHIGLATDLWYAGSAYEEYTKLGYKVYHVPRPSLCTIPWWHAIEIRVELAKSLKAVQTLLAQVINLHTTTVFLIADDTGPLEVFIIQYLNMGKVPVVLLEHGYDFATQQDRKFYYSIKTKIMDSYRRLKKKGSTVFHDFFIPPIERKAVEDVDALLPKVKPFGHNGDYLIGSFCQMSRHLLVKYGVKSTIIRDTGYPYFDRFVKLSQSIERQNSVAISIPKILVISTGFGIHGQKKRAETFYNFFLCVLEHLNGKYDVYLRFKPGEQVSAFLNPDLLKRLEGAKIHFDDNSKPSIETIQSYDLVMGEASMMLFEAIICHKSAVLFSYDYSLENKYRITHSTILKENLGVLNLNIPEKAEETIRKALSAEYKENIFSRLKENEFYLFNGLDGKAGNRVGEIILEATRRL